MNINKLWLRRQTTTFNGVPYLGQRAAAAVFTESGMAEIQANLDYYRRNAKVLADALDECGVGQQSTESYQGIISLWHIVGFKSYQGSMGAWLEKAAAALEKKHKGCLLYTSYAKGGRDTLPPCV